MSIDGIIACILTSIILFLTSFFYWKKKDLSYIEGFNEKTFKGDKNRFANGIAVFLAIIAVLNLLILFVPKFIGVIIFGIMMIMGIVGVFICITRIYNFTADDIDIIMNKNADQIAMRICVLIPIIIVSFFYLILTA